MSSKTGTVTVAVMQSDAFGIEFAPYTHPIEFHVEDFEAAKAELESRGVEFVGDVIDSGVCWQVIFRDPMATRSAIHHRYAPEASAQALRLGSKGPRHLREHRGAVDVGVHLPLMEFGDEGLSLARLESTVDAARECGIVAISANDHLRLSPLPGSMARPLSQRWSSVSWRPGAGDDDLPGRLAGAGALGEDARRHWMFRPADGSSPASDPTFEARLRRDRSALRRQMEAVRRGL